MPAFVGLVLSGLFLLLGFFQLAIRLIPLAFSVLPSIDALSADTKRCLQNRQKRRRAGGADVFPDGLGGQPLERVR